jgi:hypothetical protein
MEDTKSRDRWVVSVVVVAVFVPTVWALAVFPSQGGLAQPMGGSDYDGAVATANHIISNASGGPWTLISGLGVAATLPVMPLTTADTPVACQDIPGISIWNASRLPLWGGSLSSGFAPFWSLLFLNASRYIAPVEVEGGKAFLQSPLSPTSPCNLGLQGSLAAAKGINVTIDSTTAAAAAWNAVGASLVSSDGNVVVYYSVGAIQLSNIFGTEGSSWSVTYTHCGLPGYAVLQPFAVAIVNGASGGVIESGRGGFDCSLNNYALTLGAPHSTPYDNGILVNVPISVASNQTGGSSINNSVGLVSWMTGVSLSEGPTSEVPGHVVCSSALFSLATCTILDQGWFAVMMSSSGTWLDVYSRAGGTPQWILPNVPIYTNDSLTIFVPASLETFPLDLSFESGSALVSILGSATIRAA